MIDFLALYDDNTGTFGVYKVEIHESVGKYSGQWRIIGMIIDNLSHSDARVWQDTLRHMNTPSDYYTVRYK